MVRYDEKYKEKVRVRMSKSILSEEKERWADIKGFEGLYQISNKGRVKRENKILKLCHNNYGYLHLSLCKENHAKTILVHTLVAKAFIDNPYNYKQINHIDGNKENNSVSNLEWCSQKTNNRHAIKMGLRKARKIEMLHNGERIMVFENRMEIDTYFGRKLYQDLISRACNGKRKSAYGYQWRYVE